MVSGDLTFLDGFDPAHAVRGIYGQLAYLEHPLPPPLPIYIYHNIP